MKLKFSLLIFILTFLKVTSNTFAQDSTYKSNPFSQAKFVPDISLIIDASYLNYNLKNEEYKELLIPGIKHKHSETDEHAHSTITKGFNLNYAELYISSIVDPYFDLTGIFHLSKDGFEIEESYFTTRKLPLGLQIKGGKFFSGFGKINEQDPHRWDFIDKPIVFQSFFGTEGLNEVGAQLNWLAPTNFYLMLGFEALQGENENSFGTEGFHLETENVESSEGPNLFVGYISTSTDIDNFTGLLKFSSATGKTRINHDIENTVGGDAIFANTKLYGLSFTGKYLLDPVKSLTLQSEFLYRFMDGNKYFRDSAGIEKFDMQKKQSGLYTQLIYKYSQRWRAGIRYEYLMNDLIKLNGSSEKTVKYLPRYSAMIEFNPTEFSRIRLQYNYDKSRYTIEDYSYNKKDVHEIILQFNLSIGAHGAHLF